jgi:plastocyanin
MYKNLFMGALIASAWAACVGCAHAASVQVNVLDADGKPVAEAVVIVKPASKATTTRSLPRTASIANEKMQFIPAVSIVAAGGTLQFSNLDPYDHHVRGTGAGVKAFSAAMASGDAGGFELRMDGRTDAKPPKVYDVPQPKAGAVLLGCHLHSSMRGHVYVSDSPWTAKTDAQGRVQFDDVPDGAVNIAVWQADQWLDLPAQDLQARNTHTAAQPLRADFKLQVVPRRRRS